MMLLKLADSHVFMYKKVFSKTCIGCEMKICQMTLLKKESFSKQ